MTTVPNLKCQDCETNLTNATRRLGAVHILNTEVHKQRLARKAYMPDPGGAVDFDKIVNPAKWAIHCDTCNPHKEGRGCADCYWIGTDQLSTWRDVAGFTAHLLGKDWVPNDTDWGHLLYRIGAR